MNDCNDFGCRAIPVEDTTINEVLVNQDLMSVQKSCAERIEANLQILNEATGVMDDEIVRLPAMFKRSGLSFVGINCSSNATDGTDALSPAGNTTNTVKVGAFFPGVQRHFYD
ncbi:arginine deiminase type II [Pyrenophora seminiperda CCB06]|uniref:Arginine deiminase type II n=1 Tax=Pyrenophora seminiperda CCB06 TaxID=1302712 RepID=A0A3M7MA93_9PLEO|nr:arginine deiminase type II [Pyrenophora seminiperda CCB06]